MSRLRQSDGDDYPEAAGKHLTGLRIDGDLMIHADQAHGRAQDSLGNYLQDKTGAWRILLIYDLFYRIRVILWCPARDWDAARTEIDRRLRDAASA